MCMLWYMSRAKNMNIIFYSQKCNTCNLLLKLIHDEKLSYYFEFICVDDKIDKLPAYIRRVPTMIVTDVNKPLEGNEVLKWVESMKYIRQSQEALQTKKLAVQINTANQMGPKPFAKMEMSGFTDAYAIADPDPQKNISLQQTFFSIGDEDKNAIFTAPEVKQKLTKDEQTKSINSIESIRKKQDEELGAVMKEQQRDALSRYIT